jgi:hypothetical protein
MLQGGNTNHDQVACCEREVVIMLDKVSIGGLLRLFPSKQTNDKLHLHDEQ